MRTNRSPSPPTTCASTTSSSSGATVYNDEPLLVENGFLDYLPPRVIYTHEDPAAVAVKFAEDNGDTWSQGDLLGHLILAGHGVCFYNTAQDRAELEAVLANHPAIPTAGRAWMSG